MHFFCKISSRLFGGFKKVYYLCIAIEKNTGCSAVRLAHLLWEQGVPGSNPGIPTTKKTSEFLRSFFFLCCYQVTTLSTICCCSLAVLRK